MTRRRRRRSPGRGRCSPGGGGAPLAEPAPAAPARTRAPASERRLVSVLFADLVGFTTLSESRVARTEARVKRQFATGIAGVADDALGTLDDRIAMWDVGRAREAAWVQGRILRERRGSRALSARYLDTLDRTVGFAGRGLLVPLPAA